MEVTGANIDFSSGKDLTKAALQEKMILNYGCLPLPIADKGERGKRGGQNGSVEN